MTNLMDEYHPHILSWGDPGSQKSVFLATLPKPMLVFFWDANGKDFPYLRRGRPQPTVVGDIPFREVWHPKEDSTIIRVEYYQDRNYNTEQVGKVKRSNQVFAYEKFLARFQTLEQEIEGGYWASVVIDSVSSIELGIRKYCEYKLNPITNDGNKQDARQHYFAAADQLLELFYSRIAWLPCVVGVAAHVKNKDDRGKQLTMPDFPGAVPRRAPGAFSEVYFHFADEDGQIWLQTERSADIMATTQIPAPNPCSPHYKALFEGVKDA